MRPPEDWRGARVTLVIAGLTAAAWALAAALGISDIAAIWGGFIPGRVGGVEGDEALAPLFLTPLSATLVHSGFAHLALNLIILLFCGRAVENIIGGPGLLILYVAGAYVAAAGQYVVNPSEFTTMIGASGAVSAVLGTYAMLFGRNRVKVANPLLALWLNALWVAAAWIALQVVVGLTFSRAGIGVAIAAHIGGFLAGMLLSKPLLLLRYRKA
ncbi:MAG TPA: rhomboid family intramembrane serine protease [Allosphingosinicella sp.]|nr:rhomboid family intramembrane serine protease [Allosphingosinicella sp.]